MATVSSLVSATAHARLTIRRAGCSEESTPLLRSKGQYVPNRVAIFIDGSYLNQVLIHEHNRAKIDYSALSTKLAGDSEILRTYYYDCPPYQSRVPTQDEKDRYSSWRKFFDALDTLPRFTFRLGRLAYRGKDDDGKPVFVQKRVDLLLGIDLVSLAAKHLIQEAVLVAGDSDFVPVVEAAKAEGVLVRLFHGESPHQDLWRAADERTLISDELIQSMLRN